MSTYKTKNFKDAIKAALNGPYSVNGLAAYMGWDKETVRQQLNNRNNLDANVVLAATEYTQDPRLEQMLTPVGRRMAACAQPPEAGLPEVLLEAEASKGQALGFYQQAIADGHFDRQERKTQGKLNRNMEKAFQRLVLAINQVCRQGKANLKRLAN